MREGDPEPGSPLLRGSSYPTSETRLTSVLVQVKRASALYQADREVQALYQMIEKLMNKTISFFLEFPLPLKDIYIHKCIIK